MTRASLTIRARLIIMLTTASALLAFVGVLGLHGMSGSNADLDEIYQDQLVTSDHLATILETELESRFLLLSAVNKSSAQFTRTAIAKVDSNVAETDRRWAAFLKSHMTATERQLASRYDAQRDQLKQEIAKVKNALNKTDYAGAAKLLESGMGPVFADSEALNQKLVDIQRSLAESNHQKAIESYQRIFAFATATILGGIGLLALSGFLLVRSISRSLREAIEVARNIMRGQLNNQVQIRRMDEAGQMLEALQKMDGQLTQIVTGVRENAESVSTAASQIAQGNEDLSQRTQEQASSLEETASSMEQMTATVKQNADNARQANQLAGGARRKAEEGGAVVRDAVEAMSEISSSSGRITEIIGVIDEIAFQTNLLALNAAVEAARAGEQGRGFAVVATEVRSLAQRSAGAAKEIKDLINDSVGKIHNGTELVNASGETLEEIIESVKKVTDIVAEIAAASEEQSSGIDQVNTAVSQMDEVTQRNAALVEEAAAAAVTLDQQTESLLSRVAFFKLDEGSRNAVVAPRVESESGATAARRGFGLKVSDNAASPVRRAHGERSNRSAAKQHNDSVWREF